MVTDDDIAKAIAAFFKMLLIAVAVVTAILVAAVFVSQLLALITGGPR